MGNIDTGRRGEELAVRHLGAKGYEVIARNVRYTEGEIDIVARDPLGALAIVEVKTRSSARYGTGAEAITPAKYARLRRLAAAWLRDHPHRGEVRIDVIGILLDGPRYELEHLVGVLP